MATITAGVYPVFQNQFKIGSKGRTSSDSDMVTISDLENFSPSIDNNIEEWSTMTDEGWKRRMQTGKSFSISFSGKRRVGDAGNDYVAGLLFKTAQDVESKFEWIFPDATVVAFDCIVSTTNVGGGDSTNVGALEFEVMSDGKPTITEPTKTTI